LENKYVVIFNHELELKTKGGVNNAFFPHKISGETTPLALSTDYAIGG